MRYRPRRYTTDISVWLVTDEARVQVRMVNVSPHGARMVGDIEIKRAQSVTIESIGVPYRARVAWTRTGAAGVMFSRPLIEKELANFRRVGHSGGTSKRVRQVHGFASR